MVAMGAREDRPIMTHAEKAATVDRLLSRYGRIGALVVSDEEGLCRLLSSLEIGPDDHDIGDFLTALIA
jgi:hypothetical protein